MKTRFAAIAVLAVFVVLVSSASVVFTSDSDASDAIYSEDYYYNQLTPEQQEIYNVMKGKITNPDGSAGDYYYDIAVVDKTTYRDALTAWEALKLDNVYAFCTWTKTGFGPNMELTSSINLRIHMDDMFADVVSMKTQIETALNAIELSGSTFSDRVKSVNSILMGSSYQYDEEGATGIFGILGDGVHKLSSAGFSALFKALCEKNVGSLDINCMQVYGTLANGSKNITYAWNIVVFNEGEVYAVDSALDNKDGCDAYLCAGRYTTYDGVSFGKNHLAFAFNTSAGLSDDLESELLSNDGYSWPVSEPTILDKIVDNASWILVGVICVVLAIYLCITARKGGF